MMKKKQLNDFLLHASKFSVNGTILLLFVSSIGVRLYGLQHEASAIWGSSEIKPN